MYNIYIYINIMYINIYIYTCNHENNVPSQLRHNGFVATHVLWPKCMSIALLKV